MNLKEKNKAISILRKVYHHTNTDFDTKYDYGVRGKKIDFLTDEQKDLLKKHNLVPNTMQKRTHNEFIEEFLELKKNRKLTLDFATALFIKGLTGEVPRFRQTLISYLYLQDVKKHEYKTDEYSTCVICNLPKEDASDRMYWLIGKYLGHSWNEKPSTFLEELKDILQYEKPIITQKDNDYLIKLLLSINKADENETPGQLEKRIGKEKLLPKTDKYKRYGILQTLAILGILDSKQELDKQPARSDIVMPLAGWKGKLGVNFKRAEEIFKITMPNNV
ncbi:conserved hypothetical protein [Tenacibaculum dicentrarchi]|uniref:Uncharacterized protein n=1 Tax=Tenacibaculum dicentrarchi TaxID=669041 RepID=A0ABM9NXH9_9FLAO|nr:conserved hypothetical protein [Tenacibaculum dicentrarchi]